MGQSETLPSNKFGPKVAETNFNSIFEKKFIGFHDFLLHLLFLHTLG